MDGDCASLAELAPRAMQQGAALMVDDAHGFGVLGARGRGTLEMLDVRADIQIGTFGKAAGAAGAFVAGDDDLIDYLFQHARSRSDEHTSELQSLMRNSYAVFCLTKKQDI